MASLISTQSLVFVNPEAVKTFECAICYEILKKPVQIGCSDHIFCKECIKKAISPETQSIRCPICRFSCKAKSIRRVKFVERQINNLLVKCPNHVITIQKAQYLKDKKGLKEDQNNKEGDPDTGDVSSQRQSANDDQNNEDVDLFIRDDHDDHVSGQKRKRPHDGAQNITNKKRKVNDGFEDLCDWIGPLSDLTSHSEQCSLQLDPCGFCSDLMLRRELTRHHQDCGHYPMKCGACGEADILRHSMDSHIEQEYP
eukprot:790183_1